LEQLAVSNNEKPLTLHHENPGIDIASITTLLPFMA